MTYDGTDPDDDGTVEADVDNDSVNTVKEKRTGDSPILIGSVGRREDFDGVDADARLNNALSAASAGDLILLEKATYSDRTINQNVLSLMGTGHFADCTTINNWTIDARGVKLTSVFINSNKTLSVFADDVQLDHMAGGGSIDIDGNRATVSHLGRVDLTFLSGTQNGEVGIRTGDTTIIDNGSNRVL